MGDQHVARPVPTHKHQTSMPWEEFEPTIPASERAKTVHALDRSATVTGELRPLSELVIKLQQGWKKIGDISSHF
jgi:hypothetical protein